jgi:hypothetical protein
MKRDCNKTVTNKDSFALLIQAVPPETPMGEATFGIEIGPATPVRPVTLKEVIATGRKMRGWDGKEFSALLALRGALEACDELALAKAKERLQDVYRLKERDHASRQSPQIDESRRKFGELMASAIGLPPEESLKHYEGLRPGPRAMKNPSLLLSQEVSRIVAVWAQVALWWVNGKFVPAIYCSGLSPDFSMKIALYIHTFFIAPNGEIGFRICPYCTEQFWQEQSNQDYCRPAHREAHRVARWRNEKKLKAHEARRKSVTA